MNIIIFSKDRAMQLDALFQTIARYLPFTYNIAVVFKASNASFAAGYARLMSRAGPIAWLHESNFRSQVLSCLSSDNEYTMLAAASGLAITAPDGPASTLLARTQSISPACFWEMPPP
jgi:hypothetical protein